MPWQSARGGRAQVCMYAVVVREGRHRWRRIGRIGTVAARGALMVIIFMIDGGEEAERRRPGPDLMVAAVFRDPLFACCLFARRPLFFSLLRLLVSPFSR